MVTASRPQPKEKSCTPYGSGATVLCPGNINSNIGNAEKFRPANLKNTGYRVNEKTMASLRAIHATGIDPVELGEILKEAIENQRVICLPDHNPDGRAAQLRGLNETIENYTLTRAQRDEIAAKRRAEMMKAMEEARKSGKEPPMPMWATPEDAEPFGKARDDLDWIDPSKKLQK